MKKKLYSALTITLLAVALLIFVSRDASDAIGKDTEIISKESDVEHPQDTESVLVGDLEEETERVDSSSQVAKEEGNGENKGNCTQEVTESDDVMDYEEPSSGTTVNKLLGNDLSHEESVTSNSGVEIPVLNKFNVAALDPECEDSNGMQDWFGYVGDENASGYVNANACGVAMNELTDAMGISGGFLPQ